MRAAFMSCVSPRGGLRPPRSDLEHVAARISLGRRSEVTRMMGRKKGFGDPLRRPGMTDGSILSLI